MANSPKMRLLWFIPVIAMVLVLGGCLKAFKISIVQKPYTPPIFRLHVDSVTRDRGIEISDFSVWHMIDPKKAPERVWVIESETPIEVKEITYGVIPLGFKERVPVSPLIAGETYEISSGMAGKVGRASFRVISTIGVH